MPLHCTQRSGAVGKEQTENAWIKRGRMKNLLSLLSLSRLLRQQRLCPHTKIHHHLKMLLSGMKWQVSVNRERVIMGEMDSHIENCDEIRRRNGRDCVGTYRASPVGKHPQHNGKLYGRLSDVSQRECLSICSGPGEILSLNASLVVVVGLPAWRFSRCLVDIQCSGISHCVSWICPTVSQDAVDNLDGRFMSALGEW